MEQRPAWNEPTAAQKVSNRSILRIQELSNELRDDLNRMSIFKAMLGPVKQVLFAARDYRYECEPGTKPGGQRWYNFRLTASYGLSDKWHTRIKQREHDFRSLFERAREFHRHTAADFDKFRRALNDPTDSAGQNPPRRSVDQLLTALAVLPYQRVLPSLLEECLDSPSNLTTCCLFHCTDDKPETDKDAIGTFHWTGFGGFVRSEDKPDRLMYGTTWGGRSIDKDVEEFLLCFTRGVENPPPSGTRQSVTDIRGLAVPAYDLWNDKTNKWRGGMAGWVVVLLDATADSVRNATLGLNDDLRKHSWIHFTSLVRTYVRRVREAHMRDLLLDYEESLPRQPPIEFFENHLHQIIGWTTAEPKESGQGAIKNESAQLEISFERQSENVTRKVFFLRDTHWFAKEDAPNDEDNSSRTFPPGTLRICKLFLEELKLIEGQRRAGVQTEATLVHKTISHEFKKLIPLIVPADKWIREILTLWMLGYTIAGFAEFTEAADSDKIPEALYGAEDLSYAQWLNGLGRLAAEVEAIAKPGSSLHLPRSEDAWFANCKAIQSLINIDNGLSRVAPPSEYGVRCLLGITLLCTLRNSIQHITEYEGSNYEDEAGRPYWGYGVIRGKPSCTITCLLDRKASGEARWGNDLLITNPACGQPPRGTGGSEGTIRFFLERLRKQARIEHSFDFRLPTTADREGLHVCRLPSLMTWSA